MKFINHSSNFAKCKGKENSIVIKINLNQNKFISYLNTPPLTTLCQGDSGSAEAFNENIRQNKKPCIKCKLYKQVHINFDNIWYIIIILQ